MKRETGYPDVVPYDGGYGTKVRLGDEITIFYGANYHVRAVEYAEAKYAAPAPEKGVRGSRIVLY